jgi:hypothetical protein
MGRNPAVLIFCIALAARGAGVIERMPQGAPTSANFMDRTQVTTRPSFSATFARGLASGLLVIAATGLVAGCGQKPRPKLDMAASKVTTIGVNAYLWRATLETLSFMPLVQTDSNGGVVVTDWYANPRNPGERMKLTVSILDQDLRADALRIAASRQTNQSGNWVDAPVQAATVQKLEDIILTRARDLRRQTIRG